jgi:hypothetical protein
MGEGRVVADLSAAAVCHIVREWATVEAAIKAAKPAVPATVPPAKPDAPTPAPLSIVPPAAPAVDDLPMDDLPGGKVGELCKRDGITAARLKAYYVAAGHQPATVEPAALPEWYLTKLAANWPTAVKKM